ncbi:MAG TPA: amidohydrolase family protein [Acidimicrobiales bacterium]|nr:amidohydrolase family protein [Acidimicrobiales bacterium]
MHDLIIKGGTLVDGTGEPAQIADVAVDSGRITEVGAVQGGATRIIEADGLLVTPGWVDVHTHYDGQVTWDSELAPSSWHGVTTLVMGNCGVGFAPARPDRHDWLIALMEGVEDIPGTALAEGIEWEWETFPEYLDALEKRRWTVDVGTQVPHAAVRGYVMGERGARNEAATAEDIEAMRVIVLEAIRAGALGFSTSRTLGHRALDGELMPGTFAAEDELFGLGSALGEAGAGVFELAPLGSAGEMLEDAWQEVDWMRRLSAAIDRPVSYVLLQADDDPELWRKQLAASLEACAEGARLFPQIAGRPTGILSGHHTTLCLFSDSPAYMELRERCGSPAELATALADPEVRRSVVSWTPSSPAQADAMTKAYERTFILGNPPDYEPGPERSLAGLAVATGRTPLEVAYDEMARDGGQGLLYIPILNYALGDLDHVHEMMLHPQGLLGLADGGAHTGTICDASMPTFMLTHWTRDRSRGERLPLEYVVRKQTRDTARLYGMTDRGTVEPGALADFNLIDYGALTLGAPFVANDLPAGGRRLLQKASGYVATLKAGTVTFEHGEPTGALPGRLVRGAR